MSWRNRIAGMIEFVTDVVMDDDGVSTSQGMDEDDEIESVAGWNFGFYSRPKDGARGLVVKADGQGNTSVLVCAWDRQFEFALNKGEVGIGNAFEAQVYLTNGGNVEIDSGGTTEGAGDGEIVLNGGTKKVARVDDTAKADTAMATWMGQVEGFINSATPGTVAPLAATFNVASIAKINSGADKVKA